MDKTKNIATLVVMDAVIIDTGPRNKSAVLASMTEITMGS